MSLTLGAAPDNLVLHLTGDADFQATLTLDDGTGTSIDWPAGTSLSLVFASGTEWEATITGADAVWDVDKAVAAGISDRQVVKLRYVNGTTDQIWYMGRVVRHG